MDREDLGVRALLEAPADLAIVCGFIFLYNFVFLFTGKISVQTITGQINHSLVPCVCLKYVQSLSLFFFPAVTNSHKLLLFFFCFFLN